MRKIFVKASNIAQMLNVSEHVIILLIAKLIKKPTLNAYENVNEARRI